MLCTRLIYRPVEWKYHGDVDNSIQSLTGKHLAVLDALQTIPSPSLSLAESFDYETPNEQS